jgi:hypothetical protein
VKVSPFDTRTVFTRGAAVWAAGALHWSGIIGKRKLSELLHKRKLVKRIIRPERKHVIKWTPEANPVHPDYAGNFVSDIEKERNQRQADAATALKSLGWTTESASIRIRRLDADGEYRPKPLCRPGRGYGTPVLPTAREEWRAAWKDRLAADKVEGTVYIGKRIREPRFTIASAMYGVADVPWLAIPRDVFRGDPEKREVNWPFAKLFGRTGGMRLTNVQFLAGCWFATLYQLGGLGNPIWVRRLPETTNEHATFTRARREAWYRGQYRMAYLTLFAVWPTPVAEEMLAILELVVVGKKAISDIVSSPNNTRAIGKVGERLLAALDILAEHFASMPRELEPVADTLDAHIENLEDEDRSRGLIKVDDSDGVEKGRLWWLKRDPTLIKLDIPARERPSVYIYEVPDEHPDLSQRSVPANGRQEDYLDRDERRLFQKSCDKLLAYTESSNLRHRIEELRRAQD